VYEFYPPTFIISSMDNQKELEYFISFFKGLKDFIEDPNNEDKSAKSFNTFV
jgi:hypothetical protein